MKVIPKAEPNPQAKIDLLESAITQKNRLLRSGAEEIESLRRQNEVLRAKVDTMDAFVMVLNTQPYRRDGAVCQDIAWAMRREAAPDGVITPR